MTTMYYYLNLMINQKVIIHLLFAINDRLNCEIIKSLIDSEININYINDFGCNALLLLCEYKSNYELYKLLIHLLYMI